MTDNEIIKALKENALGCDGELSEAILDLLRDQDLKIWRLRAELTELKAQLATLWNTESETQAETIRGFARKLENALDKRLGDDIPILGDRDNVYCSASDIYNVIDNLVKEMTEGEK